MYTEKLTNLELIKDTSDFGFEGYYLKAEIRSEDKDGIYKWTVPKIALPIRVDSPIINSAYSRDSIRPEISIDLGFGKLEVCMHNGRFYTRELIESKVHKMTIEEIEKKLGYKVEIVSGK